jgi:Domain of unknown function (DUF4157)
MHDLEADIPPISAGRSRGRANRPSPAEGGLGATSDHAALLRLQRTAGNAAVAQLLGGHMEQEEKSPVLDVVGSGGGQPLDPATRSFMESRMGHSFDGVRVHTDARASESAQAVNAQAYTVGRDVVVQSDRYRPGTPDGDRLLAHELTHVVQQAAGPVSGTTAPGGIQISDPSDSFEQAAERNADLVMASGGASEVSSAPAAATASVQRQGGDEEPEEEVQTLVQRQATPEEETEEESPAT